MTFLFGVVTESSSNEYPIPPSSSLGCQHFWEGEMEALEKLGSVLSCCLSVTWNSVTCDIKKGHFDNLTNGMPAYCSLLLVNEWQIMQYLQLKIKRCPFSFGFYPVLWPRGVLKLWTSSSFRPVFSFLPYGISLDAMRFVLLIFRGFI